MGNKIYRVAAFFLMLAVVLGIAGCGGEMPEPEGPSSKVLEPEGAVVELAMEGSKVERATAILEGQIDYFEGRELFSPDFKWAAFSGTQKGFGQGIWAFALDGSDAELVEKIEGQDFESGNYRLWLLGWDAENRLIYAVSGEELIFKKYDPKDRKSEEVGRLPLEGGYWTHMVFSRQRDAIFVDLVSEIWKVDVSEKAVSRLIGELPSYDGLFYPRLSPNGDYFAYEKYEPDVPGIYVLDTETGEERLLAGDGEVLRFSPAWAPDGLHLMYYGAVKGEDGSFDLVQGENYPYPLGNFLEVAEVKTGKLTKIEVPGKKVGYARWNSNGTAIAFSTISDIALSEQDVESVEWDSLCTADLSGNVREIAKNLKVPLISHMEDDNVFYIADRDFLDGGGPLYCLFAGRGKEVVKGDGIEKWLISEGLMYGAGLPEYRGKAVIAAYRQDGSFGVYFLEKGEAKEIFSATGNLWKYTVLGDYLVLSYTDAQKQWEKLDFIFLGTSTP